MKKVLRNSVRHRQQAVYYSRFRELLNGRIITLFDVGAQGSIQPRWSRVAGSLAYIGFEPDERSTLELVTNHQGCHDYQILPHALGDGEPATLHACRDPRVSSLLPVNRDLVDGFPRPERFDVISKIPIQTSTLDSLDLPQPDFMKLDVQGAELIILQNATNALSGCIGLEVEVEFAPIYAGQPLFGEICQFLVDQGFIFIDFTSLNRWGKFNYDGMGRLMFGDALFMRPYNIDAQDTLSIGHLERFVAICVLYGRFDMADAALTHVDALSLPASSIQAYHQLRQSFNRAVGISRLLGGSFTRSLGIERSLHFLP